LKSIYRTPQNKFRALNKVGHAIHTIPNSTFQQYTMSDNVRNLVHDLGWIDPVVPQSIYIYKRPSIGGIVHSHQGSTFLYTTNTLSNMFGFMVSSRRCNHSKWLPMGTPGQSLLWY
jgi:hypothetical protein